jgi:hypothetical protein
VESGDLETVDSGGVGIPAAGMVETDKPCGDGDGATATATATASNGFRRHEPFQWVSFVALLCLHIYVSHD